MKTRNAYEATPQIPIHSGFGPQTTAEEALGGKNLNGKISLSLADTAASALRPRVL